MHEKPGKRRHLSVFAAMVAASMALSVLAACGSNGGSKSGGEVKLEFSLTGGTVPAQAQVIKDAIAAYQADHKGVKIELTEVGWGQAYQQYQTRLTGGNPPDIALLAPSWVSTFAEKNAFASADKYVDKAILDNFHETGYQGLKGKDGTRYGVQWDASVWGIFYRTDLFEKAGLDPKKPPTTWDELRQASAALKAAKIQPLVMPFAKTDPDSYFLPMLWQAGGEVVDDRGKVVINSQQTLTAANYLHGLVKDGYMPNSVTANDWEATMNTFIAGDAAIMFCGPWVVGALKEKAPQLKGKWATAAYPKGPAASATLGYPNALVISDLSDHKDVAGDFVNFLFEKGKPSYYFEFMKATGVFGFSKDFAKTDDAFVRDALNVPFIESIPFARNRPVVPWYEEFRRTVFTPQLQQLVLGKITPEEFVKRVDEGAQQIAKR